MKTTKATLICLVFTFLISCDSKPNPETILPGKWTVSELVLSDNKMDANLLEGSYMNFDATGSFSEHIMGSDNPGVWKLNGDKSGFSVDYSNDASEHEEYTFELLSDEKIIINGLAHGMQRRIVLVK